MLDIDTSFDINVSIPVSMSTIPDITNQQLSDSQKVALLIRLYVEVKTTLNFWKQRYYPSSVGKQYNLHSDVYSTIQGLDFQRQKTDF